MCSDALVRRPQMHVRRHAVRLGRHEEVEDLGAGRSGGIGDSEPVTEAALFQAALHQRGQLGCLGIVQRLVDDVRSLARRVPGGHRVDADLHFQCGRHAVQRLQSFAHRVLTVGVEIDEAGRDDEAGGVDGVHAFEPILGYLHDRAVPDRDVARSIESGFRIHDAPVQDHEVVW